MPESIDTAYMNMPADHIERIHDANAMHESRDQSNPFNRLKRREKENEKDSPPQDTYDHESDDEETEDAKNVNVQKHKTSTDAESPGFVIDILV
jgi:hypothetical protein